MTAVNQPHSVWDVMLEITQCFVPKAHLSLSWAHVGTLLLIPRAGVCWHGILVDVYMLCVFECWCVCISTQSDTYSHCCVVSQLHKNVCTSWPLLFPNLLANPLNSLHHYPFTTPLNPIQCYPLT
jgi:hypothetical protein